MSSVRPVVNIQGVIGQINRMFSELQSTQRDTLSFYAALLLLTTFLCACTPVAWVFRPEMRHPAGIDWAEYERGNRVTNASFEAGSPGVTPGWSSSGCSVSSKHSHTGNNSLWLKNVEGSKKTLCASEPFIVVPGHYDFTVWFKSGALSLTAQRHLTDALSIRLRLFDADGKELSPYVTFIGTVIDGLEFNYGLSYIESDTVAAPLGFTMLHLVPRFHPYDAGWIPQRAHSAQLLIALNGEGEVWFDDFEMRYSKWNFPLIERIRHLAVRDPLPALFPQPQIIEKRTQPWIFTPQEASLCIQGSSSIMENAAVVRVLRALEEKLQSFGVATPLPRNSCAKHSHVLTLRNSTRSSSSIDHQDGYTIAAPAHSADRRSVTLSAENAAGLVYAVNTWQQFVTLNEDGRINIDHFAVNDWPATRMRAVSSKDPRKRNFRQELSAMDWLPESRLNALFVEVDTPDLRWWAPTNNMLDTARRLGQEKRAYELVDFGVLINPYIQRRDKNLTRQAEFSDPVLGADFANVAKQFLRHGARYVVFRADDFAPTDEGEKFGYVLDKESDIKRFGTLAKAHAIFIKDVLRKISPSYPRAELLFVPPWYNNIFSDLNPEKSAAYASEFSALADRALPIIWTGPTVRSLFIDEIQLRRNTLAFSGRVPILWDNTLYARRRPDFWGSRPERIWLNSYFEPFDVSMPGDIFDRGLLSRDVYINAQVSELYRIQLASAGAFLWNPAKYHPEKALWSYMSGRFGAKGARLLLEFDANLWRLRAAKLTYERSNGGSGRKERENLALMSERGVKLLEALRKEIGDTASELLDELRDQQMKELYTDISP